MSELELKKLPAGKGVYLTMASGPVIIYKGKVLLIKDKDGKDSFWKFPGGCMFVNESPIETLIRETREETGLGVEVTDQHPFVFHFTKQNPETNELNSYVLFHFLAAITSEDFDLNIFLKEYSNVEFFTFDNLPEDIAPNVSSAISYFYEKNPGLFEK